jgi:predicted  nucleic acid-binding Zn-ribbon protein
MATEQERLDKLENENVDLKIRVKVLETDVKGIKSDISSIKDDTKWLRRTITGSLISAVILSLVALVTWSIQGGHL